MRLYLECEKDHVAVAVTSLGIRASVASGECPLCPGESLSGGDAEPSTEGWARCPCCASAWKLEGQGFACWPGRMIEEWE